MDTVSCLRLKMCSVHGHGYWSTHHARVDGITEVIEKCPQRTACTSSPSLFAIHVVKCLV